MNSRRSVPVIMCLIVALGWLPGVASGEWTKPTIPAGDPVPDVDKEVPNRTCWLATAANMLGAAGYGTGATAQERAQGIYNQLRLQYTPVE